MAKVFTGFFLLLLHFMINFLSIWTKDCLFATFALAVATESDTRGSFLIFFQQLLLLVSVRCFRFDFLNHYSIPFVRAPRLDSWWSCVCVCVCCPGCVCRCFCVHALFTQPFVRNLTGMLLVCINISENQRHWSVQNFPFTWLVRHMKFVLC